MTFEIIRTNGDESDREQYTTAREKMKGPNECYLFIESNAMTGDDEIFAAITKQTRDVPPSVEYADPWMA